MFTIGTYTGDGVSSRFINLGYTPEFILVFYRGTFTSYSLSAYGGLCLRNSPSTDMDSDKIALKIIDGGFNVYELSDGSSTAAHTNVPKVVYNYIAY